MLWRVRRIIVAMVKQQYLPFVTCLPTRSYEQYTPLNFVIERKK